MIIIYALAIAAWQPDGDAATRTYMYCVRNMARRLEPSGDAPSDVAKAATAFCSQSEKALFNLKPSEANVLRDTAIYYGTAQAVAARLCRKTKDCSLNTVP